MRKSLKPQGIKSEKKKPPFDWFGQGPTFYIDGEDEFTTYFGCILTILLFFILVGAFVYYFLQYLNGDEMKVSSTENSLSEFPTLDLGDKNFVIAMDFWEDRKKIDFKEIQHIWFDLSAYLVTITKSNDQNTSPVVNRNKLDIINCEDSGINSNTYTSNTDDILKGGKTKCLKFAEGRKIFGGPESKQWTFIELIIEPCKNDKVNCKTSNIPAGATIHTNEKLRNAYEYFSKFYFKLAFVDSRAKVDDFKSPIKKMFRDSNILRINLIQEKHRSFYLSPFTVESEYGWFWKETDSQTGITLEKEFFENVLRDPTLTRKFRGEAGDEDKLADYYTIIFLVSNIEKIIKREYELFVDVFSNVGGIAEVASFAILLFVMIHRDVCLERNLLNSGLLQTNLTGERVSDKYFYNQRTGGYMRRKYKGKYAYCEVFRFKYFSFCCGVKQSPRYQQYERDLGIIQSRLDVKRILNAQGQMEVLGNTIFEDYQMKLIPHLKPELDDTKERIAELSNEEAISLLQSQEFDKTEEQVRIDNYIIDHMDEEFKEEYRRRGYLRDIGRKMYQTADRNEFSEQRPIQNENGFQSEFRPISSFETYKGEKRYLNRYSNSFYSDNIGSQQMDNSFNNATNKNRQTIMSPFSNFSMQNNIPFTPNVVSSPTVGNIHNIQIQNIPKADYFSDEKETIEIKKYSNRKVLEMMESRIDSNFTGLGG